MCEIIRAEPSTEGELVDCLVYLALATFKHCSPKVTKGFLKKTRYFFNHEAVNEPKEWIRRGLYYTFVQKVLQNMPQGKTGLGENAAIFVNFIQKNVVRDRKQPQLEDLAADVQIICEKLLK